jgi:hypothetical protein
MLTERRRADPVRGLVATVVAENGLDKPRLHQRLDRRMQRGLGDVEEQHLQPVETNVAGSEEDGRGDLSLLFSMPYRDGKDNVFEVVPAEVAEDRVPNAASSQPTLALHDASRRRIVRAPRLAQLV